MKRTLMRLLFFGLFVNPIRGVDPPIVAELQTDLFRFTLFDTNGACEVWDKRALVAWRTVSPAHFGEATINFNGKPRRIELAGAQVERVENGILATFHPLVEQPAAALRLRIHVLPDAKSLEVSYQADEALKLENISVLPDLLAVTDAGQGYVLVPVREGLLIPADSKLSFTNRFDTYAYEGCHMQMFGCVQNGAAALVTWDDPYVVAQVRSVVQNEQTAGGHQRISPLLVLAKSAKSFRLEFLGHGDYVTVAKAYRQVAAAKGWLVNWNQKVAANPERAKLFGAIDFKLWSMLDRRMNEDSTKEESVRLNWTFEEGAQVAEHLKEDLHLDKVLFTIGGWIHRGYDNQHPDILPTAPECGGDAAFANCARRVMKLGYLFCLHDNYQDIYRDSPSWDEKFIMKTSNGKLAQGGHWAGGRAYLTCSQMAAALARRPQNLAAVRKLSGANCYFIDTTYAAGLQECVDPVHPLTRGDDMKWKQVISDYAREVFGIFGSECGREWAIPHCDFFEGLTGVSGHEYHNAELPAKLGATVIPLFELVYRDGIAMYGKYGYAPEKAAQYVLRHLILGRPLNYHSVPAHLYWKQAKTDSSPTNQTPGTASNPALFTQAENGWAEGLHALDRFVKNTYEVLSPLNELTAQVPMTQHQFLTPDRKVQQSIFGEGQFPVQVIANASSAAYECMSRLGGKVSLPPNGFLVEAPTFVAFCALSWGGSQYDRPALFTLRSLDQQPLASAHRVRVYHGFGSEQIRLGSQTHAVRRETVLEW